MDAGGIYRKRSYYVKPLGLKLNHSPTTLAGRGCLPHLCGYRVCGQWHNAPKMCLCRLTQQKGLCSCDEERGRLPWFIPRAQHHRKGPRKREAGGSASGRGDLTTEAERGGMCLEGGGWALPKEAGAAGSWQRPGNGFSPGSSFCQKEHLCPT